MEQESGFNYFIETEPFEWSLIGFLEWKSKTPHLLDRSKEHSAFKYFLQNIANDKNNTNAQRAQKLLDNWKVCTFIFFWFCWRAKGYYCLGRIAESIAVTH